MVHVRPCLTDTIPLVNILLRQILRYFHDKVGPKLSNI